MTKLFQPSIVRYLLDGKRVKRGTPGAIKRTDHSPWFWAEWTDRMGRHHKERLSRNKGAAEKLLRQRVAETDLAGSALDDPFEQHAATPLADHITAWAADLAASGRGTKHVLHQRNMVLAVAKEMDAKLLRDLLADKVRLAIDTMRQREDARRELPAPANRSGYTAAELVAALGVHPHSLARMAKRAGVTGHGGANKARRYSVAAATAIRDILPGFGLTTANHYLGACKAFAAWCAGQTGRRLANDPLKHLEKWNAGADIRRRRRALHTDRFAAFIEATGSGRTFRGLTGPDRLVLYTLAANTGFRAGELASLTPESFQLAARPYTVTVTAGYSKNRKESVQPLREDVAEMMRQYLVERPTGQPVWPGGWSADAAEVVRVDLEAAGIPYTEQGKQFDFHALRGQFLTQLAAAGVHPKVAQVLARHSTVHLTMHHYTDSGALDVGGALDKLPPIK